MITKSIRSLAIGISVLSTLALGSARIALAQNPGDPFPLTVPWGLFSFDEKGSSLLNNGPNPNTFNVLGAGGIEFTLPGMVTPGQVLIVGPSDGTASAPNGDSDLLTFFNRQNTAGTMDGIMLYESLKVDATDTDPADVLALSFQVPFTGGSILENGPEGLNSFTYNPGGGNTYFGWSDGYLPTPEPSTLVLGVLGLLSLAALAYRRRFPRA